MGKDQGEFKSARSSTELRLLTPTGNLRQNEEEMGQKDKPEAQPEVGAVSEAQAAHGRASEH